MGDGALTGMQVEVLRVFFELPESEGFVVAGGAALIASGLSVRPTDDVDLFTGDLGAGVAAAGDALEGQCVERGWRVERIRDTPTFRRGWCLDHGLSTGRGCGWAGWTGDIAIS